MFTRTWNTYTLLVNVSWYNQLWKTICHYPLQLKICKNQWLSTSTFRYIPNINTCTRVARDVENKVHSSIICNRRKSETSQRFTSSRMVKYVIYSCSEIVSSNNKEVTTAVCNNMNVINIMLSKGSYIQKIAHCRHLYSFQKQTIPEVMLPSWRQPVSNDWSMLDAKGPSQLQSSPLNEVRLWLWLAPNFSFYLRVSQTQHYWLFELANCLLERLLCAL